MVVVVVGDGSGGGGGGGGDGGDGGGGGGDGGGGSGDVVVVMVVHDDTLQLTTREVTVLENASMSFRTVSCFFSKAFRNRWGGEEEQMG